MEFGPDGAFACDLRDSEKAEAFLATNGLEDGKFLCCIPRLRYTPYWAIKEGVEFDEVKHARNEEMKEHDHAPLREAIVEVVKQTDLKVLVCPENRTQMAVGKEMLIDKLPDEILKSVVWRPDYWLTGEAVSVYVRSAGLFGNEMHSPLRVHRSRRARDCVPICRADEQGFHVGRHRSGRLVVRSRFARGSGANRAGGAGAGEESGSGAEVSSCWQGVRGKAPDGDDGGAAPRVGRLSQPLSALPSSKIPERTARLGGVHRRFPGLETLFGQLEDLWVRGGKIDFLADVLGKIEESPTLFGIDPRSPARVLAAPLEPASKCQPRVPGKSIECVSRLELTEIHAHCQRSALTPDLAGPERMPTTLLQIP